MNKLASAHERGVITEGSVVSIVTDLTDDLSTASIELVVADREGKEWKKIKQPSIGESLLDFVGFRV